MGLVLTLRDLKDHILIVFNYLGMNKASIYVIFYFVPPVGQFLENQSVRKNIFEGSKNTKIGVYQV